MICPKCRQNLREKYVSKLNLNLDFCPKCKGVWFDGGELEQALPEAERRLQIPRKAVRLQAPCPKCAKRLYAFPYPQTCVTIEMCKSCRGLWLDAGEFQQIREMRQQLPTIEEEEPTKGPKVGPVKGTLLDFIDTAIEYLLY